MSAIQQLLTNHIDIWTAAETEKRSARGRASSNAASVYGIKKLRELILELAVRGKLVLQDASDEPASKLLKRIQIEKAKLLAEGSIKKSKSFPPIEGEEKPSALPDGWEWIRLGDITSIRGGSTPSMNKSEYWDGDIPWVSPKDMHGGAIFDSELKITATAMAETNLELVPIGSILIVGRSGILKRKLPAQITAVPCTVNQDIKAVTPIRPLNDRYLQLIFFGNERDILVRDVKQGTTVQSLVYESLFSRPFGLPPEAEQHRIVAKVDELMALCDQLEAQHSDAADAHEQLVSHLLGTLTQSQCAADFNTNWHRIAAHFDILFTTEASIDALKQTLLQLAVMGKLVAQDANDEPASELLMRICVEKNKLIAEGLGKKEKSLPQITENEKLFALPAGWEFSRKADIFSFLNGYAFKSEWFQPTGVKLLRNVNISHGKANWNDTARISDAHAVEFNSFRLNVGDIVLSLDRPIITTGLKYAVISEDDVPCLLLQRVAKISSYAEAVSPGYLPIWLNSLFFLKNIDPGRSNGVPHISTTQLSNMVFALPPIKEQRRIVAKIDELMAICDQLRTSITTINQQQKKLADVLVEQVVAT